MLGSAAAAISGSVAAQDFSVPAGDLKQALDLYRAQTGIPLVVSSEAIKGVQSTGVKGELSPDGALSRILSGTGFTAHRDPSGMIAVVREKSSGLDIQPIQIAQATPARAAVETVTVTSSKLGGADVQSIPISITALSQEQLTATQTAGGPDLVKQVPNLTFTKTNFTGYSIQVRGIGTQAISVTTDPAVAVAFDDIPLIRNHFFEQEFYDLAQVEVLRGPQGTLYGRNATAGVVNLSPARPSDQFEAMASADIGNYHQRRFEGMINLPIVDDRLDIRVAGEWTKRQGYSFNEITDQRIDGRDLWSGRVSIGWKPAENLQTTLIWEHFSESDDRLRSSKQLCKTAPIPTAVDGIPTPAPGGQDSAATNLGGYLTQGCLPTSLYSADAFEVPNGYGLPYVTGGEIFGVINPNIDPYASTTQSQNLRIIQSTIDPVYKVKNDTVELNAEYSVNPTLTLVSQTGFSQDALYSSEDYNRFNTSPGIFLPKPGDPTLISSSGVFCDPQLGCTDRLVAEDLSTEHAWQLNQEFRLASNFSGPFNFSFGANYLHYETEENYYVFINALTAFAAAGSRGLPGGPPFGPWVPGVSDDSECLIFFGYGHLLDPRQKTGAGEPGVNQCIYVDPNPIPSVNNLGHNYFLSQNPYTLNSYAGFGEVYYNLFKELKFIGGLRWTDDKKHFTDIPSEVVTDGFGYFTTGEVNQEWKELTGRAAVNWTPQLAFTDQTLIYASYSHGYKGGGANPPGAAFLTFLPGDPANPVHPLTFKPEFIDAFELGTKNTLLDGTLTLNSSVFYYNYENYQISEIVDRSAINLNFDAHVKGAELEGNWEPIPGLRFNFAGGWEDAALAKGAKAIDLIDRADAAHHPDWMVIKPFVTQASNCILPTYVVAASLEFGVAENSAYGTAINQACSSAYSGAEIFNPLTGIGTFVPMVDPVTVQPYVANPVGYPGYAGFDPRTAPNGGAGFDKDLSGNALPNAPPFTLSAGAQYTTPLSSDWAGTLRGDFYWQDSSWARVFNDVPYDRIRGYSNLNLTLIFTSQDGWQVMLYDKNVFNTTAITGDFLNSDDTGLTTNVFLTDPKLIGIRVTKNW